MITVWKLLKKRKDGTLGSLFINAKATLPVGEWMKAKSYRKKGYAFRPGWHVLENPYAPHLKEDGRVWMRVTIIDYIVIKRPETQGGKWFLAKWMRINK
jgi:hypothetical protein